MTDILDHHPSGTPIDGIRTVDPGGAENPDPNVDPTVDADVGGGATGGVARPRGRSTLRWWREVVVAGAFYVAYSFVRGQFGSASGQGGAAQARAAANADLLIGLERRLGIFNELAVQQWFLQFPAIVRSLDIFYGMFHFVVPAAVLVHLYRRVPGRYRRARNTLAATTALALVGFGLFPLMPPRLLCDCPLGSGVESGFVDTLTRDGALWSFGNHGVGAVSNQYAAMPSLHFAWALWCAVVLLPVLRRRVSHALVVAYPLVTLLSIIVTANHFWLDAVGGAVVVAAGWGVAVGIDRLSRRPPTTGGGSEDSVHVIACPPVEAVPLARFT